MYNNKLLIRTYTGTYTEIFLYACCTHKNCRFGEVSFLAPVYKSSRISATQRPIRNKFGTNVENGRLVRNPQINWKFVLPTYGPFPLGRSHIILIQSPKREPLVSNIIIILGETRLPHSLAKPDCYARSNSPDNCR